MKCETPIWVNVDFVEMVLKNSENDRGISVKRLTIEPIEEDNYGSMIFRIIVEYSRKKREATEIEKKSLIIKTASTVDCLLKNLIEKSKAFETEIKMMETTLCRMNEILKESSDDNYRLNAHVLYTKIDRQSLLVIEDLLPLGFRKIYQRTLPDLEHCVLTVRRLAKFHASSVAVWEKDPDSMIAYDKGVYTADFPEYIKRFYAESMENIANEALKWAELGSNAQIYHDKLLKLSKVCWDRLVECSKPIEDEFNVLNHGDCATRNMLFRYETNDKIVEQIFIDFQTSVWCSPAMDILSFFNLALDENVDVHHRESLLCEYLDTLTSTMKRIGCRTKPPCMRKLKESLDRCGIFEIITTCVIAPLITLQDKKQATTYDDLMLETTTSKQVSPINKGSDYQKVIMRKLSEWETRGLIDASLKSDLL